MLRYVILISYLATSEILVRNVYVQHFRVCHKSCGAGTTIGFLQAYALLGKPPPPYKTSLLWKDGHWAFSLGHVDWVCNLISTCNLIHVCNIHENVIIYTVLLLVSHKAPHKVYMVLCMPPPPHEAFPWQSDRQLFALGHLL